MAIKSQLATLSVANNASPSVYNTVNQVTTLPSPTGETPQIDVSHLGSLAREFIGGLAVPGNMAIEGFYDPTDNDGQLELRRANDDQVARNMKITFSDASTLTFSALVTDFSVVNAVDEAVRFSASFQVSGLRVWS